MRCLSAQWTAIAWTANALLRGFVQESHDRRAQLRRVDVLGDQADGRFVATSNDAQHEVLAADLVVFVRQCFSQGEFEHLFGPGAE